MNNILKTILAVNLLLLVAVVVWKVIFSHVPTHQYPYSFYRNGFSRIAIGPPEKPPIQMSKYQLMDPEKERYYREKLPTCYDGFANSLAGNPNLIWYTEKEIPCTYQLNMVGNTVTGFHDCKYNLSGDPAESRKPHGKGGNANIEFPWLTGGTDHCDNVNSIKFLLLPPNKPVELYRNHYPANRGVAAGRGYAWDFPVNTVVGELLLMRAPNGEEYCFELRLRVKKASGAEGWDIELFRPYPTCNDFVDAMRKKRPNDPRTLQVTTAIINSTLKQDRLADTDHDDIMAFDVTADVDMLPAIDEELIYELMTDVVFKDAKDKTWKGADCYSPTTEARWHIVPAKYNGTFLGSDKKSCNKCHENAFDHATKFDYSRGWYGFVRGSDMILSWHPIDPATMKKDGSYQKPRILPFWTRHNLVKWRDQ